MQYTRSELEFKRGTFRAKGDIVEIYPSDQSETAIRVEFWGDEVEKISEINPLTGKAISIRQHIMIFPNSHYATTADKMEKAIVTIQEELKEILNNAPDWWSRTTSSNISDNITIRTANTVRKIINR